MDSTIKAKHEISSYFRSNAEGLSQSCDIHMRYRNESANITERTVSPRCYFRARDGREFLKAWCHMRKGDRTFRVDRIEWMRTLDSHTKTVLRPTQTYHSTAPPRPSSPALKTAPNPTISSTPAVPHSPSGRTPTPKQKSRHYFLKAACAVIAIMLAKGMFSEHELKSYSTPSRAHMMATRIRTESRTSPVSRTESGAGASSQSSTTPVQTPHERAVDANTARFTQATGITDKRLVAGYIAADRDKSASLSWDEIGVFNGDSDAITPT